MDGGVGGFVSREMVWSCLVGLLFIIISMRNLHKVLPILCFLNMNNDIGRQRMVLDRNEKIQQAAGCLDIDSTPLCDTWQIMIDLNCRILSPLIETLRILIR